MKPILKQIGYYEFKDQICITSKQSKVEEKIECISNYLQNCSRIDQDIANSQKFDALIRLTSEDTYKLKYILETLMSDIEISSVNENYESKAK